MYYICDIRKPNEPFLLCAERDGKFVPAIYADKAKAEEICFRMNLGTSLTQFAVKEVN